MVQSCVLVPRASALPAELDLVSALATATDRDSYKSYTTR